MPNHTVELNAIESYWTDSNLQGMEITTGEKYTFPTVCYVYMPEKDGKGLQNPYSLCRATFCDFKATI